MNEAVWPLDAPSLLGRYRPRILLARGGTATLFEGIDETLGRRVAIKVFDAGADLDRYREELRLLAGLSHHGVVSIVDAGIDLSAPDEPRPFLVMQLIRGKSIYDTLRQDSITLRQAAEIGYEVAEALDYVHSQGVVHRDITPANVMLTNYGSVASRSRARITDFGIAIAVAETPVAAPLVAAPSAPVSGTVAYLSPEQVRKEVLTPATDIYSLGLVMLECFRVSTRAPGETPDTNGETYDSGGDRVVPAVLIPKAIPRKWRALLSRMTSAEPFDRPTAAEVAAEIRELLRGKNR